MKTYLKLAGGIAATAALCLAVSTRTWLQSDYSDFEKGNLHNLSVRSDGVLTLAPQMKESFDSSSAYLWALAQDSKGNLYTGGGPGANLFRLSGSQQKKLAEFEALEIHAIAVNSKDEVFVATSPDGKVYKLAAEGKPKEFYDPKQKYIWAMVFDRDGTLYVATGDQGEVHRVDASGKGSVYFKSEETHARSMVMDAKGDLIVGTEPGGLIVRLSPAADKLHGQGFVLYQMGRREITALAIGSDGSIYAAGVGSKQAGSPVAPSAPAPPVVAPVPAAPSGSAAARSAAERAAPVAINIPSRTPALSGGTDVYRIHPDGYPERIWTGAQDVVYAMAFDVQGHVILGAGNKGSLYRIDTPSRYTSLVSIPANQITALVSARDGSIWGATGNVGKVYHFGPGLEKEGWIESDVFDASGFSYWGRLAVEGEARGGRMSLVTRSGNLDRPQQNWSSWAQPDPLPSVRQLAAGGRIASPPARFLQWKAVLTAAPDGTSPEVDSIEAAYLSKNVAPTVGEIEITPTNYKFASPAVTVTPNANPSITLPAIGKRPSPSLSLDTGGSSSMTFAKGWIGARWTSSDENGDALTYTVEIRGARETAWKLLKDKVREKQHTFDSTAFPDGEYRVRVVASDLPGNAPADALTGELVSNPFVIDNTPPEITGLAATRKGNGVDVRWHAADALNVLKKAEYSVDGEEWLVANPVNKLSDSLALDYNLTIAPLSAGEHTIAVRVSDDYDNSGVAKVVAR